MATPISRDDRRAVSCSGLRPSQLTAPKTYTTRRDITGTTCRKSLPRGKFRHDEKGVGTLARHLLDPRLVGFDGLAE